MKNITNKILFTLLFTLFLPFISHAVSFPTKIDTLDERINIQVVLNTVMSPSPNLTVDGVLGRKSIQAIQAFQESRGLVPDGKVGPITRSALEQAQGVTTTTTSSSNTSTTSTTTSCSPGALYNTQTGKPCNTTTSSNGCTSSTKYSPITGAYCGNTTTTTTTSATSGGGGSTSNTSTTSTSSGGGSSTTTNSCSGSSSQFCSITNGSGTQSRTCSNSNWSSYNTCTVTSCNSGYQISGNSCVVIPSTPAATTKIIKVTASYSQDGSHLSEKTLDRILNDTSYWAAEGDGQWLTYELDKISSVGYVRVAFYANTQRYFDIQYSTNGTTWANATQRLTSASNKANQYQTFSFTPVQAKYIRIVGHGSSAPSLWNSITETDINGFEVALTSTAPLTCSGSSSQSCSITNGSGTQSRTCTNGTWSSYNSCTVSTCNNGYTQSGNNCVVNACTPESSSVTCSGKCGTQTNNCGTSVSCTACSSNEGDYTIYHSWDFEDAPLGAFNTSYFGTLYRNSGSEMFSIISTIKDGIKTKALQIQTPGDPAYYDHASSLYYNHDNELAVAITPRREMYLTYNWKFSPNYQTTDNAKLFGLGGMPWDNIDFVNPPEAGWKQRQTLSPPLKIHSYWYDHASTPYGQNSTYYPNGTNEFYFNPGNWYSITMRVVMNSSRSLSNGIVEIWVDGVRLYGINNRKYEGTGNYDTRQYVSVCHFYGGSQPTSFPTEITQGIADNLTVWVPKNPAVSGNTLHSSSYFLSTPDPILDKTFVYDYLVTTPGKIQNTEYGGTYSILKDETFLIDAGAGKKVTYNYSYGLGSRDFLLMYDGNQTDSDVIRRHAGENSSGGGATVSGANQTVTSSGRYMFIRFVSDKSILGSSSGMVGFTGTATFN